MPIKLIAGVMFAGGLALGMHAAMAQDGASATSAVRINSDAP